MSERWERLKGWPWGTLLLWLIYLALLVVLLPHTAWAFGRFEPEGSEWVAWAAAFAFEAAVAALTHKLTGVIENTARIRKRSKRLMEQYLNAYALGLYVSIGVSALANFAHAVEFGQPFVVYTKYSVPELVYSVAFGGILPFCSLLFARILANVQHTEADRDEALEAAKASEQAAKRTAAELRQRFATAERQAKAAEERAKTSEEAAKTIEAEFAQLREQFAASEARVAEAEERARAAEAIFAEDKQQRILGIKRQWPELKNSAIAILSDASPSYVSETLNGSNGHQQ